MKQLVFREILWEYFMQNRTANIASKRLRALLARDRAGIHELHRIDAELSAVLARYFTVADFSCHMENDVRSNRIFYTMEAEVIK